MHLVPLAGVHGGVGGHQPQTRGALSSTAQADAGPQRWCASTALTASGLIAWTSGV